LIFDIQPHEKKIFELVAQAATELGFPAFIVGGYVRDRLLRRPSKDMDIVCVGDGIRLAKEVAKLMDPKPRVTVYGRFGTAMLHFEGLEVEFVGARKESYSRDSRKPTVRQGSLEDDQNRRDFTINAMAVSLQPQNFGELLDPFGGLHHLEQKVIKTPLEPGSTFSDDPLRMMRAIRFATQLDFTIEPETLKALAVNKNRLKIVSKERITTELNKIILADQPSIGFKHLEETGLLELFFPEMTALKGVDYQNGKGHKDNFYHTLEVLENVCKNLIMNMVGPFMDMKL